MTGRPLPFRSPAIAKHVLAHAAQAIDQPENIVATEVYTATAEYWQTYIRMLGGKKLGPQDVLNMLADLAKVKSVIGQGDVAANYIEAAACVAGAAVMANAQFPQGGGGRQAEMAAGGGSEPQQSSSGENGALLGGELLDTPEKREAKRDELDAEIDAMLADKRKPKQ